MDEIPLLELIFYARRLCRIYFIIFCINLIALFLTEMNKTMFGFSCFYIVMLFLNIVALRFVIVNATNFNVLVSILFTSLLELMMIITTILFSLNGFYDPWYIDISPIIWVVLELSTIYILYGFYKKLANPSTTNEINGEADANGGQYTPPVDNPISYAKTAEGGLSDTASVVSEIEIPETPEPSMHGESNV